MDFKKFLEKLSKGSEKNSSDKKNVANLLIVLLVGVLMILTVSFFKTSNTMGIQLAGNGDSKNSNKATSKPDEKASDDKASQEYESGIQQKLKDTLEKVDGVGKVEVMVSFESGEEQIPAVNINDSTSNTEEKDTEGGTRNTTQKNNGSTVVITNEGDTSKPLIVKTYKPKVSGVCVVAEGADNKVTELRITKAITDLFNIPENKVNVYPMKK